MRVFTQRSTTIVLVCGVACIAGILSRAESAEPDKPAPPILTVLENPPPAEDAAAETHEDRIRRVLHSRVRVEMTDVPLAAFARELGERLGIPVVLKHRPLRESDIGGDLLLSFTTPNMPARTMLRQLLREYELAWLIENEVLAITTQDDAECCRVTRVYDARDLVTVYDEDGRYYFEFGPFIDMITSTVQYETWQEFGGEGLIDICDADRLQAIVVTNTAEVHEEIDRLLSDLRAHIPDEPGGESNPTNEAWRRHAKIVKDVTPREPRVEPAEVAVRRALLKRTVVPIGESTLGEFAREMESLLGVQVRLKTRELRKSGIDPDLPMTVEVAGMSARAILNLMLEEHELAWMIEDGCLMITTRDDAENTRYVRVYDVTELLLGTETVFLPSAATSDKHQTRDMDLANPSGFDQTHDYGDSFCALIDMITSSVKYHTWQEYGGEGLIESCDNSGMLVLVVSQTREVHDAVEELFAQLRQVRREGRGLPMPKQPLFYRPPIWSDPNLGCRETEWMGHGSLGGRETRRSRSQRMGIRARPVVIERYADRDELVVGGNRFALDLYAKLREADREGNLFFSPMSVSTAMAMAQAGARGATADEIAQTMHFTLPQERLHPACRSLLAASRGGAGHELAVANRLWMQSDYTFLDSFLRTTRDQYGAEGERVDFAGRPDEAMRRINQWTSEATRGRIPEAVTRELMLPELRLVLTNAIYFKGRWLELFNARGTQSAPFFTPKGEKQAPLMSRLDKLSKYAKIDDPDVEILEKDYEGSELSMLVLLPKNEPGSLERLEAALTAENLEKWREQLRHREVQVFLPRFRFNTGYRLEKPLQAMGIKSAFGDDADFSGIDGVGGLSIFWIVHKATVEVDEVGTVAAAFTGMGFGGMGSVPEPPPVFRADHPFVFLIVDNRTRSILFVGRLTDPT